VPDKSLIKRYPTCISDTTVIPTFPALHLFRVGLLIQPGVITPWCLGVCHQHRALPLRRTASHQPRGSSGCQRSHHLPARSEPPRQELPSRDVESEQRVTDRSSSPCFCLRACTRWVLQNSLVAWQEPPGLSLIPLSWKELILCGSSQEAHTVEVRRVHEKPHASPASQDDSTISISSRGL